MPFDQSQYSTSISDYQIGLVRRINACGVLTQTRHSKELTRNEEQLVRRRSTKSERKVSGSKNPNIAWSVSRYHEIALAANSLLIGTLVQNAMSSCFNRESHSCDGASGPKVGPRISEAASKKSSPPSSSSSVTTLGLAIRVPIALGDVAVLSSSIESNLSAGRSIGSRAGYSSPCSIANSDSVADSVGGSMPRANCTGDGDLGGKEFLMRDRTVPTSGVVLSLRTMDKASSSGAVRRCSSTST